MAKENVVLIKSYAFAVRVVELYKFLLESKKEYVLSKQVLRSGTSIGANVEEAMAASSKRDFICKLDISAKEARETSYWLRLLKNTQFLTDDQFSSIHNDCNEIQKIISRILITSKDNL